MAIFSHGGVTIRMRVVLAILLVGSSSLALFAQNGPVSSKLIQVLMRGGRVREVRQYSDGSSGEGFWRPHDYSWVSLPWSQDSTPYLKAKKEVDALIHGGISARMVADRYERKMTLSSPPLERFRYAYALTRTYGQLPDSVRSEKRKNAVALLSLKPFPRAYEYIRLRFLLEVSAFPQFELLPLGKRLFEHNPQDTQIKRQYATLLSYSSKLADIEKAVQLSQELVKADPNNAGLHSHLGSAYDYFWIRTRQASHGRQAIAAYEKYLSLAPSNDTFRPHAKERIVRIGAAIEKQKNVRGEG